MIANHPSQWMTPQDKAEIERIEKTPIEQLKSELRVEGVDIEAFLARIRAIVEKEKKK